MTDNSEQQFSPSFDQQTAVDCLAENTPFSKQQLKLFMQKGAVWLQTLKQTKPNRIRRAKKTLSISDILYFYYNATVLNAAIASPKLISDEINFSVWYKPKGVLCQGSKWADHTTINRWIETNYQFDGQTRSAIIVHRLDKATDGLMLIAHNHKTAKKLTYIFANRQLTKIYHAKVKGIFEQATTFDTPIDNKSAISHVKPIKKDRQNDVTLVEVHIETGRKHQIRKHISQAGFPIIGDRLYGNDEQHTEDLQLTSVYLQLNLNEHHYEFSLLE